MSINKVILAGNLTRTPELRRSAAGNAILNMGIAVNNRKKDSNGEWVDDPCFVDLVMFGKRAESVSNYLDKGTKVAVEGKLSMSQWEDRNSGQKRTKLEVIVDELEFMSRGSERKQESQASYDSTNDYFDFDLPF